MPRPCLSFAVMETGTARAYLSFGFTDELALSLWWLSSVDDSTKNSGLPGIFSHASGEETDSLSFIIEGDSIRGLWLWEYITGSLVAIIRGLVTVVMTHYLCLLFGSSICIRILASATSSGQPELIEDVMSAEDWLLPTASAASSPCSGGSDGFLNILADIDYLRHYFDYTIFSRTEISSVRWHLGDYDRFASQNFMLQV